MACYLIHQIVYNPVRNNNFFSAGARIYVTFLTSSRIPIFKVFCKQLFKKLIIFIN